MRTELHPHPPEHAASLGPAGVDDLLRRVQLFKERGEEGEVVGDGDITVAVDVGARRRRIGKEVGQEPEVIIDRDFAVAGVITHQPIGLYERHAEGRVREADHALLLGAP